MIRTHDQYKSSKSYCLSPFVISYYVLVEFVQCSVMTFIVKDWGLGGEGGLIIEVLRYAGKGLS